MHLYFNGLSDELITVSTVSRKETFANKEEATVQVDDINQNVSPKYLSTGKKYGLQSFKGYKNAWCDIFA
jgi:hypothetical protein